MGDPRIWYKAYLEYFAKLLSDEEGFDNIKQMSVGELETYISESRYQLSDNEFYYKAGMAAFSATDEAYHTSGDDFNAAAGALCEFEDFIELYPEMV